MKMKLNYDVNFGSFGIEDGQFSEPSGVCVTSEGFIAVTDTKNHRIQVSFRFKKTCNFYYMVLGL